MSLEQDVEEITKRLNHMGEKVAKIETNLWWIKWILLAIFAEGLIKYLW